MNYIYHMTSRLGVICTIYTRLTMNKVTIAEMCPLDLIKYSKTCLKQPLKKKTDYCLKQVKSIAECSKRAFYNTFDHY